MRMGVHQHTLAPALAGADEVWLYTPSDLGWDAGTVLGALAGRGHASAEVDALAREVARYEDAGWVADRWAEVLPLTAAEKQQLLELADPLARLTQVAAWSTRQPPTEHV